MKFFKLNLQRKKSFKKEDSQKSMNLYWRAALLLMLIMVGIAFFLGYQLFTRINTEPISSPGGNPAQVETVKKEDIDKTLQYFTDRAAKSAQIINSPSPVVDPSL